jgi:hypothetical protein
MIFYQIFILKKKLDIVYSNKLNNYQIFSLHI